MALGELRKISASELKEASSLEALVTERLVANLDFRLRLDSIDDGVVRDLTSFSSIFYESLPEIISDFYQHMLSFDQTRKFFHEFDVSHLKAKQLQHWQRLFSAQFDEEYVRGAVRIGLIHHKINLPLYLYLAGYNRVLCDLSATAIKSKLGALESSQLVTSIIKVVSLDMDIAISCYFLAENIEHKRARKALN